jgi:hypothetical protein
MYHHLNIKTLGLLNRFSGFFVSLLEGGGVMWPFKKHKTTIKEDRPIGGKPIPGMEDDPHINGNPSFSFEITDEINTEGLPIEILDKEKRNE